MTEKMIREWIYLNEKDLVERLESLAFNYSDIQDILRAIDEVGERFRSRYILGDRILES